MKYKCFTLKTFKVNRKWYKENGGYAFGFIELKQGAGFYLLPTIYVRFCKYACHISFRFLFWVLEYNDESGIILLDLSDSSQANAEQKNQQNNQLNNQANVF